MTPLLRSPRKSVFTLLCLGMSLVSPLTRAASAGAYVDFNKNGAMDAYENPALPVEARVADLLGRMTLEEKTAQMVTLYGYPRVLKDELPTEAWKSSFWKDGIGNIDEHMNGNTGWTNNLPQPAHALPWSRHAAALNTVQRWFVENTRLGIPVDFTNEGIRGLMHAKATSFPAQIAVASTWNRSLVREIGRTTGREARALGYTNVYSPVLDVARDPRWGRIVESYSEDPFLVGELGYEQACGIQEQRVVSTPKHFAIYSVPKGGRDGEARTDPQVTWREVQQIFLPPWKRVIKDAGVLGVMSSYNDYDGVPVQASRRFLTEILREQYQFRGYVVSDSGAVEFIHTKHRTADTPEEAIRQSVVAGLNIRTNFTPPEAYGEPLRKLVREGRLPLEIIDQRVAEVLRVKFWQGLFDNPYVADTATADSVVRAKAHLDLAESAGRESIILLKNQGGLLPLDRTKLGKVLVVGPLAEDNHGWWSRYGAQHLDFVTPLAGLKAALGPKVEVLHVKGVPVKDARFPESDVLREDPTAEERKGIDEAVVATKNVDVIIACLGETDDLCRESASRVSLDLPGHQEQLLRALHATGKPVVLVLSNGRPLSVNWAAKHVPAIVEMWFPGESGGRALAEVLLGDYNPAGRLSVTFPKGVGQLPMNFPAHPGSQGRDAGQVEGVLWPFGHGLSYTHFKYEDLRIATTAGGVAGKVTVTCRVTNDGSRDGDEVVQLYLRDDYSSVVGFEKQLRGFERIHLRKGETRELSFELGQRHLELFDANGNWTVEPGRFTVQLGASSEDIRLEGGFVLGEQASGTAQAPKATDTTDPR